MVYLVVWTPKPTMRTPWSSPLGEQRKEKGWLTWGWSNYSTSPHPAHVELHREGVEGDADGPILD